MRDANTAACVLKREKAAMRGSVAETASKAAPLAVYVDAPAL